jgi:diguanylate cyclase
MSAALNSRSLSNEGSTSPLHAKDLKAAPKHAAQHKTFVQDRRDHEYTLVLGETAFELIKGLRLPADPPSFGVWYAYAGKHNPALNQAINEKLQRNGSLSVAELDQIYDRYVSPSSIAGSLDVVGEKIGDEVGQVVAMIEAALGVSGEYQGTLADANRKLAQAADSDSLRSIVASLIEGTKKVEGENSVLQAKLRSSAEEIGHLRNDLDAARQESFTDPLTRIGNRMCFDRSLENARAVAENTSEPLSLLLGDIDHFKEFNDTHGHLVGDDVLRLVALELKNAIKGQDIATRYGGEEFAVILPNTSILRARAAAENIRSAVGCKQLVKRSTGTKLGRITISIGVAEYRTGEDTRALIERADRCLYAAKRDGRDRVVGDADLEN